MFFDRNANETNETISTLLLCCTCDGISSGIIEGSTSDGKIVGHLRSHCSQQTMVLGPVASAIPRIKDRYRYQCMIKYKREPNLKNVLKMVNEHYQAEMQKELQISIDFNPTMLM